MLQVESCVGQLARKRRSDDIISMSCSYAEFKSRLPMLGLGRHFRGHHLALAVVAALIAGLHRAPHPHCFGGLSVS